MKAITSKIYFLLFIILVVSMSSLAQSEESDSYTDAIEITELPFTTTGNNSEATLSNDEPLPTCTWETGHTVWYQYTPEETDRIRLDTSGSDFDTVLSVWTRRNNGTWQSIGCSDLNLVTFDNTSNLSIQVESGVTYYIMLSGYEDESGDYRLEITAEPQSSSLRSIPDDVTSARQITSVPFNVSASSLRATNGATDPTPSCRPQVGRTVWYVYQPQETTSINMNTAGSEFDTVLSVWLYDGEDWTEVSCDDDISLTSLETANFTSDLTFEAQAGETYFIMVAGYYGFAGDYELNVEYPPCLVTARGNVNMRSGPGTDFETPGRISAADGEIPVIAQEPQDDFTWWQLESGNWVRSDTVAIRGACSILPLADEAD